MATSRRKKGGGPMTLESVRALALALPGVEEGTSYGTPAFKVRGKLLARLREDGESLVVKADLMLRDELMRAEPESFFLTDHYQGYPLVLVRLAAVRPEQLRSLLVEAWRGLASQKLLAAWKPEGGAEHEAPPARPRRTRSPKR